MAIQERQFELAVPNAMNFEDDENPESHGKNKETSIW